MSNKISNMKWAKKTKLLLYFTTFGAFVFVILAGFPQSQTITNYEEEKNITIHCTNGRLGNQMAIFAVLYGLARLNHRRPVIQECLAIKLSDYFEITLPVIPKNESIAWKGHPVGWVFNPKRDSNISKECNIINGNYYPDSYTFFDHAREEIRKEFTFKPHLANYARQTLISARNNGDDTVFVGVHVRRTDYIRQLKQMNRRQAGLEFFRLAFVYFRKRYVKPVFVIASDDMIWCRKHLAVDDAFFRNGTPSGPQDLAMLAHCNHSIITYGTFSWWSAYLAGGETVYMGDSIFPGSWFDYKQPENETMLPNWLGISEISSGYWQTFKMISKIPKFI